jgi:hypothetical protein
MAVTSEHPFPQVFADARRALPECGLGFHAGVRAINLSSGIVPKMRKDA